MDHRVVDGIIFTEYKEGIEYFCDYAFGNAVLLHQGQAHCPYKRCDNKEILDRDTMTVHLYRSEFMSNYKHWYLYGEMWKTVARVRNEQDRNTSRMIDMVMDAAGSEFNWNMEDDSEASNSDFYHMLRDVDEPLWSKYEIHTVLSSVSKLLILKVGFNMMVNCYDRIVAIIKKNTIERWKACWEFLYLKKNDERVRYGIREKIDACHNDCMLFYKEDQLKSSCDVCSKN